MLAGAAVLVGTALSGCLEEDPEDESSPPPSRGVDVLAYENGHPLLTDTTDSRQLAVEDELLRLTNEYRASRGLPPVLPDPVAQQAARAMAKHMRVHRFRAHDNPEGDGPGDRLWRVGLQFDACGENIAWGWESARRAFAFWVGSPPHRENLEDPTWTHAGMGYWAGGEDPGIYYALEFVRLR
jgi:uncharacterized protein YkwD